MTEIDKDFYHTAGKKRKKKGGQNRTEVVHVRLFPDEKKLIDEKIIASGRSVSELIRISLNEVRVAPLKNIQLQNELIREVRRVGINMNQIARACNETKKAGDEINLVELIILLKKIEEDLSPSPLIKSPSPPAPSFDLNDEGKTNAN